jgi:cytochrome c oxidase cbb3-type subunit 3
MKDSVSLFIIVFTVANIAACVWLMWWTAKRRDVGVGAPDTEKPGEKTGHVWDGDLEEYNNPLPRWWLGLFIITIVFGVAYLIMYPGLGKFTGTKGWTETNQHAAEVADAQAKLEKHLAGLSDKSVAELATNEKALSTGHNLFGLYCSSCHGSDARGAKGFPNLTDSDWLWGGNPETIYQTISQGRMGVMPAWGGALGDKGVEEVAAYVLSLSGRQVPEDMKTAGQARFATMCIACHGVDGKGNQTLGAPNLTDDIWLYGGTIETVRETISKGRNNQMPAHEELLGPMKTKLLTAYVYSLSAKNPATAATTAEAPSTTPPTTPPTTP